uniref:peptidylprolyl isomerase n=1 Tax=Flavobacterium sp. TaxID=239 RepID=UPI0040498599
MAVLGKIRQRSALIIVVIGLAMFAFLLPELLKNGFSINSNNVGSINGKDVLFEEFRMKVDNIEKSGQATGIQAVNRVWDIEVNLALITEEIEKLGIRVGESHILNGLKTDQSIGQNQMFQNEAGEFDIEKLRVFLSTNPEQKAFIESKEKDIEVNSKYQIYTTLVRAGFYTTMADAKFKYDLQNRKVNFQFVSLPYSSVNDSEVSVSDQEILDYMKANEKKYKAEETREIEYVFVEEKATEEDINEVKTKITSLLEDKVKYIEETKTNDTIAGFRDTADYIEFVNSNSETPFDSTYYTKADLPAKFSDTLFNLVEGTVYGPYQDGEMFKITRSLGKRAGAKAKASHILISYDGTSVSNQKEFRTKEEARTKADSLYKVALKNPDDFSKLATEYSDDSSGQRGGDLGFFNPGQMVKPFNDYVFDNPINSVGLVETDFGFHIIKVTDKEDAIQLATVSLSIFPSDKTTGEAYDKSLSVEMEATSKPFTDVAAANKLEIQSAGAFKVFDENFSSLGAQRAIVRWAFDKDSEENSVKRFEITDKGYVIARVKKINEKGFQPVETARLTVEPILKNKKKAVILAEKAKGDSLETIAKNNNVTVLNANQASVENAVISGAGFEPKVVGIAISSEVNKISEPIEGVSGVYVIKTLNVNNPLPTNDYSTQLSALKNQGQSATGKIFTVLKDKADIEDNRAKFNY